MAVALAIVSPSDNLTPVIDIKNNASLWTMTKCDETVGGGSQACSMTWIIDACVASVYVLPV